MLGVGCGCERDRARGDGPDADASEARDARREDGDEPEHVSCPLGRDAHEGATVTRWQIRLSSVASPMRWLGIKYLNVEGTP
jgi:hypothetical protein